MVVHIHGGKGRKDRDVMLSPALLKRCASTGVDFVTSHCVAVSRQPMAHVESTGHDQGAVDSLPAGRAGLEHKNIHPHTLRHCGFVRIRNFGFLANRQRAKLLPLCFSLLGSSVDHASPTLTDSEVKQSVTLPKCPLCSGTMRVVERFSSAQLLARSPPPLARCAA